MNDATPTPAARATPLTADSPGGRTRLLQVAMHQFAAHGFDSVTVRTIVPTLVVALSAATTSLAVDCSAMLSVSERVVVPTASRSGTILRLGTSAFATT